MKDIPRLGAHGWASLGPGFVLILFVAIAVSAGCYSKKPADLVYFDVKAGFAVETLKEAARQAEVEFIFSMDLVQDLKTPTLQGNYRPAEAFERMLAHSPFSVVRHEQSGVYSIQRAAGP